MGTTEWDHVAPGHPGGEWLIATENGWGVLAAWAAGADNVRKVPVDDSGRTVDVECRHPDGRVTRRSDPFTTADRQLVDETTESYLLDAGIPLPPRGWVWLIRRPKSVQDDRHFWRLLNQQVAEHASAAPHPSEVAPLFRRALADLYG